MKRRNFLKTACMSIAGIFGFKTAQATTGDEWLPYGAGDTKGKVKVLFQHGSSLGYEEYDSDAENLNDVPRQALKKYPFAFDIQLKKGGKTAYQWYCFSSDLESDNDFRVGTVAITESVWKERRFAENGMGGPWMTSSFNGDQVERRVFYIDVTEDKAEKILVALKRRLVEKA